MFLGTDLNITPLAVAQDASELDLVLTDRLIGRSSIQNPLQDVGLIHERENLAQALILRLLTPKGSLAALGHANYGSRVHELIGRNKTSALRDLCRKFVLEAVAQEPRVENKAVELTFDPLQEQNSSFVFSLTVQPLQGNPLSLSLEVGL